jgi:hypothetical protein
MLKPILHQGACFLEHDPVFEQLRRTRYDYEFLLACQQRVRGLVRCLPPLAGAALHAAKLSGAPLTALAISALEAQLQQ